MWASSGAADARPRTVAIRELIDAYAFCADAHDAEGQKALFTDDTPTSSSTRRA